MTVTVSQDGQIVAVTYDLTSLVRGMVDRTEVEEASAGRVTASYEVRLDRLGEPVTISMPTDNDIIDPATFSG